MDGGVVAAVANPSFHVLPHEVQDAPVGYQAPYLLEQELMVDAGVIALYISAENEGVIGQSALHLPDRSLEPTRPCQMEAPPGKVRRQIPGQDQAHGLEDQRVAGAPELEDLLAPLDPPQRLESVGTCP